MSRRGDVTLREGTIGKARFAPDGETVVYSAAWDGEPFRVFTTRVGSAQSRALDVPPSGDRPPSVHVYDLRDGSTRQITPDGVTGPAVLSPDGGRIAVNQSDRVLVYPADGGEPQPLRGAPEPGKLVRWSADGRALFVVEFANTVARLFRRDLATGERVFVREIKVHEPAGVTGLDVWVSGDGAAYAYSALRRVSNLFVIEGLR